MKVLEAIGLGLLVMLAATGMAASEIHPATTEPALPADTRCSISTGSPVVDYGTQARGQLQNAGNRQTLTLGKRTVVLSVGCPYSQSMRLALRGAQAPNGDLLYGDRGSVKILVQDAQIDGQAVQLTKTTADGVLDGVAEPILQLQPGKSFAATLNGHFVQGKSFSAQIEIEPIFPVDAFRASSRQTSESLMTWELLR